MSDAEILFPSHALDVASPDGNQLPTKMEKNGKRDGGLSDAEMLYVRRCV